VGEGGSAHRAETDEGCCANLESNIEGKIYSGIICPMPHQSVPAAKRRFARSLRRDMTEAEQKLWLELRGRRLDLIKFRRQVPIGPYIADFACLEARLVVEIDGSQHADSVRDTARDAELKQRGFRVLRFWNDDVLRELDAVCDTIIAYVRDVNLQPWR